MPLLTDDQMYTFLQACAPLEYGGCIEETEDFLRKNKHEDLADEFADLVRDIGYENIKKSPGSIGAVEEINTPPLPENAVSALDVNLLYVPVTRERLDDIMERAHQALPDSELKTRLGVLMNSVGTKVNLSLTRSTSPFPTP